LAITKTPPPFDQIAWILFSGASRISYGAKGHLLNYHLVKAAYFLSILDFNHLKANILTITG